MLKVKVLGVFAMIDEGETDWKVMAIDVNDPLAENLNDIQDVDKIMPGFLKVNTSTLKLHIAELLQFAFNLKQNFKTVQTSLTLRIEEPWTMLRN